MASLLRCLAPAAVIAAGLAACSGGAPDNSAGDPGSQATGVGEVDATAASSGFNETDLSALRPETDESRETLWRLKGHTVQDQLRR